MPFAVLEMVFDPTKMAVIPKTMEASPTIYWMYDSRRHLRCSGLEVFNPISSEVSE
jgi:hypothetical protein